MEAEKFGQYIDKALLHVHLLSNHKVQYQNLTKIK